MPKITYTSAKGLVQEAGSGISFDVTPISTVQAKSANVVIVNPGVYTLSSSVVAPITGTMPLASAVPGGQFIFRNTSAHTNVLTGSAETGGTQVFVVGTASGNGALTKTGSKLALQGVIGSSVKLSSDGKNYIVTPGSGSITISDS